MTRMSRLLRDKKADFISSNVLNHIPEIVFIITVSIFMFFILHVDTKFDTFPIESEILFSRILYGDNGLWFYDKRTERLYPGILEFERFNNKKGIEDSLRNAVYYGEENKRAAAELVLKEGKEGEKRFEPVYYNEEKYRMWIERYKAGWKEGAGGFQSKIREVNLLIKKEDGLVPGVLSITVVMPNE